MSVPAVVTGIGVVAPTGLGTQQYWSATVAGINGIRRVTRFDPEPYTTKLAGEISGFDPARHLPSRLLPQTDRMTKLALVAAEWALADAGIDPATLPEYAAGVVTASASGGFEFGQRELEHLWSKGPEYVSAYQSFAWFYAVNTGQISIRHGMRGPSGVLVAAQAGGLDAIAQARRQIRKGISVMVTGGVDSALCPWGWVALLAPGHASREENPGRAYRPFARDADGWVPGEGGAILILESVEAFQRRGGARGYGVVAGYAASFDPPPGSDRPPTLRRAIESALREADVAPHEVDVVFADAAGVPEADRVEAEAIVDVFGPHGVPVTAPKTMTGRLFSGGAPLDVATALLAIRDGIIPPSINVDDAGAYPLDLVVGKARRRPVDVAVVIARGYRGFNSVMVLRGLSSGRRAPEMREGNWNGDSHH